MAPADQRKTTDVMRGVGTISTAAAAISVRDVVRDFGDVRAVDGLSFDVGVGQVFGLLGHNGAGKTTTIRILNGLLARHRGTINVLGLDPQVAGADIRARTGVLTESPSIDERLTARENLTFVAQLFGVDRSVVRPRVNRILDQFRLADRADDRASTFSRGMKQRVALGRTLLHEPELLFLDEPTAALDPVAARDVHELIRELAVSGTRTVVVTTHNLVEAERLCDHVVILREGRLIAQGAPREITGRLSGTRRVTIEVGPGMGQRAAQVVRQRVEESDVTVSGDVLLMQGVGRESIPAAVASLTQHDIDVYGVTGAEPSLEDAYLALYADGTSR